MDSYAGHTYNRFVNNSDLVSGAGGSYRTPYERRFTFQVTEKYALFSFGIRYTFVEGALFFKIEGDVTGDQYVGGKGHVTLYPYFGKDQAFTTIVRFHYNLPFATRM